MNISSGGKHSGIFTIANGAVVSASEGSILDFDVSETSAGDAARVNDLSRISGAPTYTITVAADQAPGTYALADGATGFDKTVTVNTDTGDTLGTAAVGNALVTRDRPFIKYGLSLVGGSLALEFGKFKAAASAQPVELDGETVNTDGRAARWTANTVVGSGTVNVVSADFGGDAWLDIDGADLSGNVFYGAAGDFSGVVNIHAGAGKLRNVAAGAQAGGSVGGVDLTLGGAEVSGAVYAGGFGSVTSVVNTAIGGGTFAKDVFAGALANKNSAKTSVGDVTLSVTDGTFAGNLYGAAAVRTAATVGNGLRHTAGDVRVTIAGGSAERPDFCCFAGGYATGNATETVYTVESVTAELSGGAWGEARGGRGIYGGIFASQVEAKVAGDVNITISGGAMGNVYGGGWAQKNGTSCVAGDVNITVTGGSLGSIYGGGSHSTSVGSEGSATVVGGDIYITLAGGDISGGVYTRGQLDGDSVEGSAYVTVTGNVDYRCGIYGYSYDGSEGDARLEFADYTGGFSGALGGFNEVALSGATVTEFSGAVSNQSWLFELAGRAETLAGTAFLTWDDADFSTGTVKLRLDGEQAPECAWDLVRVAGATAFREFDVLVGDDSILADTLALDEAISGGFADGWGFTIEDSVLKFKQLA